MRWDLYIRLFHWSLASGIVANYFLLEEGEILHEWVGYIATAVLLTSFAMKQLRTLRIVNSVACLLFVVYGVLLTNAWPIIISNAAIFVINIYYLFLKKNQ